MPWLGRDSPILPQFFFTSTRSIRKPNSARRSQDGSRSRHCHSHRTSAKPTWAQGSYRYRVLRDFEGALSSYKQAQQLLPNSALVNEYPGYVLRRLGRWEAAEPDYRKAIELDPLDVQLLSSVGAEYYVYLRRFKEAYVGLDRAIQIAPDADNARAVKAGVLMNEGRLAEADQELAKIPADAFDDFIVNNRLNQHIRVQV